MEDLIQQERLPSVSHLNDFVELCYGEFFGWVCQTSLMSLMTHFNNIVL